ncbi:putative CAP domain-containing protein [Helianthus annuus]|nr:putative CAP domain-containing protein [Helianthus annuus]KAJ0697165.1 putative CAP domain-containing protein [Helianthus annuus]
MGVQHYSPLVCIVFISILHFIYTHNAPEDYVKAHNAARKEIGLQPMTWDTTVAKFAEQYANQRKQDCALIHSHSDKYGENIAVGWVDFSGNGEFSGSDAVKLWVDEKPYYNYTSNSCTPSKMCGHYTQVVWKKSIRIGCARVKCASNAFFVTCNYDPPGNYIGEKPY